MFNLYKWHRQLISFLSPSFIGDIIGAVSNAITPGVGLALSAGANLLGSAMSSGAASDAAATQAQAGLAAQQNLLNVGANVAPMYTPYMATGQKGLNNLNQLINSGYLTQQFGPQQLQSNLAPNYGWGLSQGQQANIQASNVAGGGSNVNRANQMFTQNYAQNAYQNAFNNYNAQRTNIYNQNAGLAGLGQNAVSGAANAQLGLGTNISNITQGIGNAQAAGQIGSTSALAGGLSNLGNTAALYGLLQKQGGTGYTPLDTSASDTSIENNPYLNYGA